MNIKDQIPSLLEEIQDLSLEASLLLMGQRFAGRAVFSSALGQEDQVIAHAIFKNQLPVQVFSLDTGRLFHETYALWEETEQLYQAKIKAYYPDATQIEDFVDSHGINSFYESVENRKLCCNIRKVQPLKRALAGASVWITGLRAAQSDNRSNISLLEWDEAFQIIKFNPIIGWSYEDMLAYLALYHIPSNKLHQSGFISIGCAPCTRAIAPGEEARAGRWWWEQTQKECGLHANYFNK